MGSHDIRINRIANNIGVNSGIYGDPITSDEMRQLIKAFETNHLLTKFVFSPKSVEDLALVSELFETLNKHKTLQELKIATGFQLSKDNLAKLVQLITTHSTLRSLTLRESVCSTKQLRCLTDELKNCKRLSEFVCMVDGIPDDAIFNIIIKLIGYNHMQSILVRPKNVTKEQTKSLVNALQMNTHLKDLGLVAIGYEPGALQPLLNYLKINTTLTDLGLGNITNISDFKKLADAMSKNKTLTSLSCEITPTNEFFNTAYMLIANNNALTHFGYFTEDHKLGSSPDLEKLLGTTEKKISKKLAKNKARLAMSKANSTSDVTDSSKKRSIEAAYAPSLSSGPCQKRILHSLDKEDENTSENTKKASVTSLPNLSIKS